MLVSADVSACEEEDESCWAAFLRDLPSATSRDFSVCQDSDRAVRVLLVAGDGRGALEELLMGVASGSAGEDVDV